MKQCLLANTLLRAAILGQEKEKKAEVKEGRTTVNTRLWVIQVAASLEENIASHSITPPGHLLTGQMELLPSICWLPPISCLLFVKICCKV